MAVNKPLTPATFSRALRTLEQRDPDIRTILSRLGPPPFWHREPGFPTLIRIILEQQVSLASARAAFQRLLEMLPELGPETFLLAEEKGLKEAGFSRQKTRYGKLLAKAILEGSLSLNRLASLDDARAKAELLKITGIGPWTADIYLLMALRRPDIWPAGDMALMAALQAVKGLESRPSLSEMEALSRHWSPWRGVAARVFWHHYLGGRGSSAF
jgi:DNA-3-methyladenine glycosylase II